MAFILIHGGGSSARFWDRLAPLLPGEVLAVDLPGRGAHPADLATITVDDEASSVVADVVAAGLTDPLIVVAHSSGGLVVPGVVRGLGDRVAHIVLNAALVPPDGGTGLGCMKPHHREGLVASVEMARADGTVITLPGAPADPEPFRTAYGGPPLDDADLAYVTDPARCVPDTVHHYFQPVSWAGIEVPVTYVLNEDDRPVTPAMQELMIGHLPVGPTVVRLPGGHLPAVTRTEQFAALLGAAGASVSG